VLTGDIVNFPVCAVAMVVVTLCLPKSIGKGSPHIENKAWAQIFKLFEPIGAAIFIPSIICLLLAFYFLVGWGWLSIPVE
jgi:hypothetical protein